MLTQKKLKEILHYDSNSGLFIWKIRAAKRIKPGDIAGCLFESQSKKKYIRITISGKRYFVHNLAWLYVHGHFPDNEIDHADGNGTNNKIKNLSDVVRLENGKNKRLSVNNKSGHVGVHWHCRDKRWQAYIMVNKKSLYLGTFTDKNKAIEVRKAASIKYNYHKNHGTVRPL